ncbi:epoxyqueuosine reductase QueH [Clostridium sp.]|uniref:epoxyqueuosine reductase QueH n=1 Tax=Clostridium sp. TaxID=1506 RepID=UPI0026367FD1|nr:epoxyqueuosine reductase QueH [Clostridium sp.]
MNKINYQKELDSLIEKLVYEEKVSSLLLHSCCAPCSSYVLEYLSQYFSITIFFYNPNIYPVEEYSRRVAEQKGLISELKVKHEINFIEGRYDTENFYEISKGLEKEKEGGERCFKCYELRLKEAAIIAKSKGFEYFTTTLSISPHKNSQKLNAIGKKLSEEYNVEYLYSDFKKKEGYKRSIELSKKYNLYRQDYCGCVFSKNERMNYEEQIIQEK